MQLKGQVALVTGGAKRVGRAIALALAARGCRVAIPYRSSDRQAETTLQAIQRVSGGMRLQCDQRDPEQVQAAVNAVKTRYRRIDILINNASSWYPTRLPKVSESQWDDLLSTNLLGPWRFAQATARVMQRQKRGKIINIADVSVLSPWPEYLPYCAAKGALVTLSEGLAKVLAPHIQVNAIAPGPILFPKDLSSAGRRQAIQKTLLKRCGDPKDIAQTVLFLLEGTDFITGALIPVDGGRRFA